MATITSNGTGGGKWNTTDTWNGGVVPADTDRVIVADGDIITVEGNCVCGNGVRGTSSKDTAQLVLEGTSGLKWSRNTDGYLGVKGTVWGVVASNKNITIDMGTDNDPIPDGVNATINVCEDSTLISATHHNSFYLKGYGADNKVTFTAVSAVDRIRNTYLIGNYAKGVTTVTVSNCTGWKAGDKIFLTPQYNDDYSNAPYRNNNHETLIIDSISNNDVTFTESTAYPHGYIDEVDYEAGTVHNLTSNVKITGNIDGTFYGIYTRFATLDLKGVSFEYINSNSYNENSPIYSLNGGRYGYIRVKDCALSCEASGNVNNGNTQYWLTTMSVENITKVQLSDIAMIIKSMYGGNRGSALLSNTYGKTYGLFIDNIVAYNGAGNGSYSFGFYNYQIPVIHNKCKILGFINPFAPNNSIGSIVQQCWSIGAGNAIYVYNGSANINNHNIRFCKYLVQHDASTTAIAYIKYTNFRNKDLSVLSGFYANSNVVPKYAGSLALLTDIKDNPKLQERYETYGVFIRDINVFKTSVASIKVRPTNNTIPITFSKINYVNSGKQVTISAYLRKDSDYNGSLRPLLRLKCSQFDVTQEMSDTNNAFELVTLTSPILNNSEQVVCSIEAVGTKGYAWVDEFKIGRTLVDIGTELFLGGTEISNVVDITDTSVKIKISVTNPEKTPIENALVYVDEDLQTVGNITNTTTDVNGNVLTSYNGSAATATIRVRKYGYKPYITTISLLADSDTNVRLIVDPQQI